ncbi:unnamed protein product [Brassica napus]|uniref:(rape) hypothetical protein n=1 Tax=Brassica napus TaxID=3708 RepID=A0A816JIS8_BRANA|nr:unnamed protein product [Brassica napus]
MGVSNRIIISRYGPRIQLHGPNVKPLLAFSWKLKCSPKLRHFVWKVLSGILPVAKVLKARGINCDPQCSLCGAEEETINHVLFECPPTLQTKALSRIPSPSRIFPSSSGFTNLDYLFWRVPKGIDSDCFLWIMWYIWKNRNENFYQNRNENPQEILRKAEVEGTLWAEAQLLVQQNHEHLQPNTNVHSLGTRVCYVDGAWREQDAFTGQGWYCRARDSDDVMMGAMNLRRSLSPLHAECEALIWAMECMKTLQFTEVVFATDCSQLVKMVSSPEEWPDFATHMEEFCRSKTFFPNFKIRHIPRAQNTMADKLARGVRSSPSAMLYVDSSPPA